MSMMSSYQLFLVYRVNRKIGKSVHPMVVVNWLSIMGILVPILPIAFYEGFVVPKGTQWLLLLALGVVAFLAQSLLNNTCIIIIIFVFVMDLFVCIFMCSDTYTGPADWNSWSCDCG